jgi:hypothetical protein
MPPTRLQFLRKTSLANVDLPLPGFPPIKTTFRVVVVVVVVELGEVDEAAVPVATVVVVDMPSAVDDVSDSDSSSSEFAAAAGGGGGGVIVDLSDCDDDAASSSVVSDAFLALHDPECSFGSFRLSPSGLDGRGDESVTASAFCLPGE